jgi:hypothetical protein
MTINYSIYVNGKDETWISDGVLHPETLCANAGQVDIFLQQQKILDKYTYNQQNLKMSMKIVISKDDI